MDLIAFRVQMYKGILDSGWIEVNPLTVLVGKNESGKTSLLRALHKLNPFAPDPYQMAREWPRGHRKSQSGDQEVCQAKFRLSEQDKLELARITSRENFPETIEVSRHYAGEVEVNFGEEVCWNEFDSSIVDVACESVPNVNNDFSDCFKDIAEACLDELRSLAAKGQLTELRELAGRHELLLEDALSLSEPPRQIENDFFRQYVLGLEGVVQALEQSQTRSSEAQEYVRKELPTFIYMSDYRAFSGSAQLNEVKTHQDNGSLTEEDKTFLTILELSGLDVDDLVQQGQGNEEDIEQRQFDLDDGAATLSSEISNRLRQRQYKVEYRADGQRFFTFVKDDHDPALIRLEERSKGFQWFFSFDLMLMHESKGTFEGCVILLDEPGLHLHPDAQKDLLLRLDHYAEGNTLLYSTHLPFMIDLNHPDRIRVLKETENGIVVTTDFTESPPEAKLVLQAALGMDASHSFLVAERNLVVEGVDDYWILTELSNLLRQDEEEGLPEDVLITPGGGASVAVHIATFMIGQGLGVVALFDSDDEGRRAQEKLVKTWLERYKKHQTKTLLLGDAVEASGNFAIEDLFPEDFIAKIAMEAYSKQLTPAGVSEITLDGDDIVWKRILRFMKEKGVQINKGPLATRLQKKLSNMKNFNELPCETQCKAIKLFKAIRRAFGEGGPESS